MHKSFYASGFFYNSSSQQILLQQNLTDDTRPLALFCVKGRKGEDPTTIFRHSLELTLGISLKSTSILPVYDYVNDEMNNYFIFYVDSDNLILPPPEQNGSARWFALARLSKLNMTEQTRHDIIVGERVIRAAVDLKQKTSLLLTQIRENNLS